VYQYKNSKRKSHLGKIATFKVNRIKEVTILDEDFDIPENFNIEKLLGSSWGVMWGDEIIVKLKFSANVARRVKETVWHQSQQIHDLSDGSCTLTLQVGSTLEMTPWIRGWGPDVEVFFVKKNPWITV
jgi:proteasome accessory factor B